MTVRFKWCFSAKGEKVSEESGLILLFGSGETSPSGQKVFDWLFRRLVAPVQVAILETPAGFELNSPQVAGRIGDFVGHHLQNYRPQITIVPARKRGTPFSPDDPEIANLIPGADAIFMGPGSPTFAVRQLHDSLTWHTVMACHRLGAAVILASSAAIAASAQALPVYEIFKVGEDLHWRQGLDLLKPFGLSLVFIPHWNNQDGGGELDTSRCYMGQARFDPLLEMLPSNTTVVGIDEHTALAIDLAAERCQVLGKTGVTLIRAGTEKCFTRGQSFSVHELGPFHKPNGGTGLPVEVWTQIRDAQTEAEEPPKPSADVLCLIEQREAARSGRDWATADTLRQRITGLGWKVKDTQQGPLLEPL
jgi:hypothetical protein